MGELSSTEREIVERARAGPTLEQVLAWAAINSGSRNLDGLSAWPTCSPMPLRPCPAISRLDDAGARRSDRRAGAGGPHRAWQASASEGSARRRPCNCFSPATWTRCSGRSSVSGLAWIDDGVLNGPGVADMKGGLAVMLAALKAVETSPRRRRFGYEVVINSDEEVGSLSSAPLLARAAAGKRAALTYEPAALPDGTLAGARPGSGNFAIGRARPLGPRRPQPRRRAQRAARRRRPRATAQEAKRGGLKVNPVADRRRQSEQCRARPRDAARQFAPRAPDDEARGASSSIDGASPRSRPSTTSRYRSMAASAARPSR